MLIVTIPWPLWLAYLPLLITWRLTCATCLLMLRIATWTSQRIYRAARTQIKRRRAARHAAEATILEEAS